jgi:uncharacterized Zn finger protein (UPF0148 family)
MKTFKEWLMIEGEKCPDCDFYATIDRGDYFYCPVCQKKYKSEKKSKREPVEV